MLNIILWGIAICVGVPAILIAVLAIAVCLSSKKLDKEREGKHENISTKSTDG